MDSRNLLWWVCLGSLVKADGPFSFFTGIPGYKPPQLTDQQRIDAFNQCVSESDSVHLAQGLPFLNDVLSGNFPTAVVDWVKMVIAQEGDNFNCMDLLSPAQRAAFYKAQAANNAAYPDRNPGTHYGGLGGAGH